MRVQINSPFSGGPERYAKKFEEQETEIEKRQKELSRLREVPEKEKKRYEVFLPGLNVEG